MTPTNAVLNSLYNKNYFKTALSFEKLFFLEAATLIFLFGK